MLSVKMAIIAVFVVLAIALAVWGHHAHRKRIEAFTRLASEMGFRYEPDRDRTQLGGRFEGIDLLRSGSNRYTENHLLGERDGRPVTICDFHYETHSTDSKGRRTTHHHYHGVIFIELPIHMSQVRIRRESIFDKIASAIGLGDINFESAEFSRRFHVAAAEQRFAYDLIHPRTMEYLLARDGYSWEFDGAVIAMYKSGRFSVAEVGDALNTACGFVPLIPEYVWADRGRGSGDTPE